MVYKHYATVCSALVLFIVSVQSVVEVRRGGWLDRLIEYHKDKFYNDFEQIAPIKINATMISMPEGYRDSNLWDFDSVMRLLVLIKDSEVATDVFRVLRQIPVPTRRLIMNGSSYKYYPSLVQELQNDLYNDYVEETVTKRTQMKKTWNFGYQRHSKRLRNPIDFKMSRGLREPSNNDVIVVSNPVEAKLPSAEISIQLLKDIMISRAIAGREMPTNPPVTVLWVPMNKTSSSSDSAITDQQNTGSTQEKPDDKEEVSENPDASTKTPDAVTATDQQDGGNVETTAPQADAEK